MQFKDTVLEGVASFLPAESLSSEALESKLAPLYQRLGLTAGRLELMTGIAQRRLWPEGTKPSQVAAQAAGKLLNQLGLGAEEIDLLIYAGVCRDQMEPATATTVHAELGLSPHTTVFDLSNACLGFLNAIALAGQLISAGQIRRALITSGEDAGPLLQETLRILQQGELGRNQIKPYFANFTIGSGAVAACVAHADCQKGSFPLRVTHAVHRADTTSNQLCQGGSSGNGFQMQTDSEKMLQKGVALAQSTWTEFLKTAQWNPDTPEVLISHQVGKQHRKHLYEALQVDPTRDFSTFEYLGNVGSASVPLTLLAAQEAGVILPGDSVALLGIGSGLSCMMMALEA